MSHCGQSRAAQQMEGPWFRMLFESIKFTSRLFNITVDEGHCISQWGGDDFRPQYKKMGILRWLLPDHIRFHITSAMMPPLILDDIQSILQFQADTISSQMIGQIFISWLWRCNTPQRVCRTLIAFSKWIQRTHLPNLCSSPTNGRKLRESQKSSGRSFHLSIKTKLSLA